MTRIEMGLAHPPTLTTVLVTSLAVLALPGAASADPPANDDFANAEVIPADQSNAGGFTLDATKEPGEPNHAGQAGGKSVWFSWTAPSSGPRRIDTCGTGMDVVVAVYTGSAVAALTEVASDDNGATCSQGQAELNLDAVAGTTYFIAVDSVLAEDGAFVFSIRAPPPPPPPGGGGGQGGGGDPGGDPGGGAAPERASCPRRGRYRGTTAQRRTFCFTYSSRRRQIRNFRFAWRAGCDGGTVEAITSVRRIRVARNGRFRFSSGGTTISGRIRGRRVSGTLRRSSNTPPIGRCDTGARRFSGSRR